MQNFDFDNLPEDQPVYPVMRVRIIVPSGAKEYAEAFLRKEGYTICTDRHKQSAFHFSKHKPAAPLKVGLDLPAVIDTFFSEKAPEIYQLFKNYV